MNRRRWTYVGISAISVAGLAALGVNGLAGANSQSNDTGGSTGLVNVGPATAPPSGTQVLTLSAAAFAPDGLHTTTSDYFNEWDPATLTNSDTGRCFNAGVNLPTGAKISSVTFDYTEGSTVMYGELNRQDLANHTSLLLASFDSPTTTGNPTYTSTTITVASHKNVVAGVGYGVGVCPNGTTTFSGVTIDYTG
jgi:hypothetical protein